MHAILWLIQPASWSAGPLVGNEVTDFLRSLFTNPDRMVVAAAVIGVLALFIITRGKWK